MSITKITERVLAGAFEEQFAFDPATSSGSTFGFTSGTIQGNGLSNTIPSGTVTFSGESYIYIDWNRINPKVKSIPIIFTLPEHALLLYQVRSITSMDDFRSWSMATTLRTGEDSSDLVSTPDADMIRTGGATTFGADVTENSIGPFISGDDQKWLMVLYAFSDDSDEINAIWANGATTPTIADEFLPATNRVAVIKESGIRMELWFFRDFENAIPLGFGDGAFEITAKFNQSVEGYSFAAIGGDGVDVTPSIVTKDIMPGTQLYNGTNTSGTFPVFGNLASYNLGLCCIGHKNDPSRTLTVSSTRSPWVNWFSGGFGGPEFVQCSLTYVAGTTTDNDDDQTFTYNDTTSWAAFAAQGQWDAAP